jgi:hypothetical protein
VLPDITVRSRCTRPQSRCLSHRLLDIHPHHIANAIRNVAIAIAIITTHHGHDHDALPRGAKSADVGERRDLDQPTKADKVNACARRFDPIISRLRATSSADFLPRSTINTPHPSNDLSSVSDSNTPPHQSNWIPFFQSNNMSSFTPQKVETGLAPLLPIPAFGDLGKAANDVRVCLTRSERG